MAEATDPDAELLSWSVSGLPLALAQSDASRGKLKPAPPKPSALPGPEVPPAADPFLFEETDVQAPPATHT